MKALSEDMFKENFHNITNCDYSKIAIHLMQ